MEKQTSILFNPVLWLVLALTLGLMPYTPEPHIWEKLKWVFSGAEGMLPLDWFDLFLHGTPWALLFVSLAYRFSKK